MARSYVTLDSAGYDPADPIATSHPDDYSPRDRVGHGTAIAMIAAGVQNTGPGGTIQGVAPKAFLGNYKIIGSPSINPFARFAAFQQALAGRPRRRHGPRDILAQRRRPRLLRTAG